MHNVELFGEFFALNPREEYEWAMMEFADAALGGADTDLLSGAAAVMELLKAAIAPGEVAEGAKDGEDWLRFKAIARKKKAQTKRDLMPIVVQIFTQAAERPTGLPSGSSDGQSSTLEKSEGTSSSPVATLTPIEREVVRLEKTGRPDRAVYLLEHLSA